MIDTDSDLQRRIDEIEGRQAIAELAARYAVCIDDRDIDALLELFTKDATMFAKPTDYVGREAIRGHFLERWPQVGLTVHTPQFGFVEFDGPDRAHGVVGGHNEISVSGVTVMVALRHYDEYLRVDGHWKIHTRATKTIYAAPADELRDALDAPLRIRMPGQPPVAAHLPVDR
jgi:ketosteroid isomerase-like protein